jgi:hypothetical protein
VGAVEGGDADLDVEQVDIGDAVTDEYGKNGEGL